MFILADEQFVKMNLPECKITMVSVVRLSLASQFLSAKTMVELESKSRKISAIIQLYLSFVSVPNMASVSYIG